MRRIFLTLTLLLRVYWGEGPNANGIFVKRVVMMRGGRPENYFVVKTEQGLSVVAEEDIIKTKSTEEKP